MWNDVTDEALVWARENNTKEYKELLSKDKWYEKSQKTTDPELKNVYEKLSNKFWTECRIQREYEKHIYKQKIMRLNNTYQDVGSFEVKSGKLFISDPCYSADSQNNGVIENVINGTWKAKVFYRKIDGWGLRVCNLVIEHENSVPESSMINAEFAIGVDSGLAGFSDYEYFLKRNLDFGSGDWYRETLLPAFRHEPLNMDDYVIVDNSVVACSTGFGDGSYVWFYWTDKNSKVCKAMIKFIDEEEF